MSSFSIVIDILNINLSAFMRNIIFTNGGIIF